MIVISDDSHIFTTASPESLAVIEYPVRLLNRYDVEAYHGRVEILVNNTWGTICDSNWGTEEGEVVCKQLGYPFIM